MINELTEELTSCPVSSYNCCSFDAEEEADDKGIELTQLKEGTAALFLFDTSGLTGMLVFHQFISPVE